MSIATEIQALNTNLTAAKGAVTAKGGTVGNTGLAGLATEIAGIPSGGGSSKPATPPAPSGAYVHFSAFEPEFSLKRYESADPSITVTISYGGDIFGLAYVDSPDFALDSVFCESPNTGEMYNIVLKWDAGSQMFKAVFFDSSDQENTVSEIQEYDLESYGISFSDTSFMYEGQDVDLAYLLFSLQMSSSETNTDISDSTEFSDFMTPPTGDWGEQNTGEGFYGLSRFNGTLIQKYFITDINFGTLAEGLTNITNGFCRNYVYLRTLYNLPSTVTSIGEYFLGFCRNFNSYFELPASISIGNYFLEDCSSFNQPFAIPSGATLSTSSSYHFIYGCNSMVSAIDVGISSTAIGASNYIFSTTSNSAPCYTTGITLEGTYGDEWSSKLGNRTSSPYRKLLPSIAVQPTSIEVGVGYTTTLTVAFYPDTQPKTGTWSSSDTSVATVNQNGVVTGVAAGSATITFQTATGLSSSASITSRVILGEVELSNGKTALLKTNSDITAICKTPDSHLKWTSTINGVTFDNTQVVGVSITSSSVTSLGNHFLDCCKNLVELELPSSITSVGDYFLRDCSSFNESLSLPNLASCGNYYMAGCNTFNQPLSLPSLTSFGTNFLSGCIAFNQNFTIPAGATGTLSWAGFMYDCRNMTGTLTCNAQWGGGSGNTTLVTANQYAPAYTTGITLAGTYASDWKTALPDLNGPSNYRKLIVSS